MTPLLCPIHEETPGPAGQVERPRDRDAEHDQHERTREALVDPAGDDQFVGERFAATVFGNGGPFATRR